MHFSHLLTLASLAAAAPTSPTTLHEATWTLHNFVRVCDDTVNVCTYTFSLLDNHHATEVFCEIHDYVKPTEPSPLRSARYSSPSNLPCNQDAPIYVNIGYDHTGDFYVVVPVDTAANTNAFFGYSAAEIADHNVVSPDHESLVLPVGTFVGKRDVAPALMPKERDIPDLGAWTVRGFERTCSETACDYGFTLDQGNVATPQPCHLTIQGNNTRDFFAEPCRELMDWVVSWGYNDEFGFAVMTVAQNLLQEMAFFGFDDVNKRTQWADAGPNAVIPLCGGPDGCRTGGMM